MAWEKLASTKLTTAGDVIDTGTFTAKKYLMVQTFTENAGVCSEKLQFNSDTGNNYARRRQRGSETTDVTSTSIDGIDFTESSSPHNYSNTMYIINIEDKEKLGICEHAENTNGAGNAPNRGEWVFKWANTTNQITSIQYKNVSVGSFDEDSEVTVYGTD